LQEISWNNFKNVKHRKDMEIRGKIIQKLDQVSGTSKAGKDWVKQEYILETLDSFPKKICFDFFGEKVNQYPLNVGEMVDLSFDIESREYQGRWYTNIRGWKAEKVDETAAAAPVAGAPAPAPIAPAPEVPDFSQGTQEDDLPF